MQQSESENVSNSVISDSLQTYLGPTRLLCPWNSPGKNTGEGCHFLLQGIFPTQGSNLCLLHLLRWQANSLPLSHLGNPCKKVSWSKICTNLKSLPLITTSHQLYGPCLGFPVETFSFGTLYWFNMDSSKSEVMSEFCKTSFPI